jgi:hypothetical protein
MLFGPTQDGAHTARAQLAHQPETARKARSELGVDLLEKRVVSHQPSGISKSRPDFRLSLRTDY